MPSSPPEAESRAGRGRRRASPATSAGRSIARLEQAADIGFLQHFAAPGRRQAEQAGDRIEAQRSARHFLREGDGQVVNRAAQHQIELCRRQRRRPTHLASPPVIRTFSTGSSASGMRMRWVRQHALAVRSAGIVAASSGVGGGKGRSRR